MQKYGNLSPPPSPSPVKGEEIFDFLRDQQKCSIAFLKLGHLDFEIACPVKWGFGNFWFDVLQSA